MVCFPIFFLNFVFFCSILCVSQLCQCLPPIFHFSFSVNFFAAHFVFFLPSLSLPLTLLLLVNLIYLFWVFSLHLTLSWDFSFSFFTLPVICHLCLCWYCLNSNIMTQVDSRLPWVLKKPFIWWELTEDQAWASIFKRKQCRIFPWSSSDFSAALRRVKNWVWTSCL